MGVELVENWKEYNEALVKRGDLSVWIAPEVFESWTRTEPQGRRGRRLTYSDSAITWILTLGLLYRLPLRAGEGLARWLMGIMGGRCRTIRPFADARRGFLTPPDPAVLQCNAAIVEIELRGGKEWKERSGYHARSRVEAAMFRFKTIIGERMRARLEPNQQAEALLGIKILNHLRSLGMPVFGKIQ